MNSFGHIGLTLAAAYPAEQIIRRWLMTKAPSRAQGAIEGAKGWWVSSGSSMKFSFDYRLIIIGAMIPDAIDKPLGFLVKPEFVNNGLRTVAHSGVFNLTFLLVGLLIWLVARNPQVVLMACASAGHLALDQMWKQPYVLFWPLLDWRFPRGTTTLSEWLNFHLNSIFGSDPLEYFGGAVILLFALYIISTGRLIRFLKTGFVT